MIPVNRTSGRYDVICKAARGGMAGVCPGQDESGRILLAGARGDLGRCDVIRKAARDRMTGVYPRQDENGRIVLTGARGMP